MKRMCFNPLLPLSSGYMMPQLGLGTFQGPAATSDLDLERQKIFEDLIIDAIDIGYRHFDTAEKYMNHAPLGRALKRAIREKKVTRDELFITSKVWPNNMSYNRALAAVERIRAEMGCEYLDLCLIHWPTALKQGDAYEPLDAKGEHQWSNTDFMDTWKALEEAVKVKKVRSIGVSNFNSNQIARIIKEGKIPLAVVQIECHPYLNQKKLIDFCNQNNIVVTGYAPLAKPSDRSVCGVYDRYNLFHEEKLIDIAIDYKKSIAQVILRWQIQRGISVIPKSAHTERLKENWESLSFNLGEDAMQTINSLNANFRVLPNMRANSMISHKQYPFGIEF